MSEGYRALSAVEADERGVGERYPVDAEALARLDFEARTTCWHMCDEGQKCMRVKNHTGPHVSYTWRNRDPGGGYKPEHVRPEAMWFS